MNENIEEFNHEDGEDDDAYSPGDIPFEEIDWEAAEKIQALFKDAANPDTETTAEEVLKELHGDSLELW